LSEEVKHKPFHLSHFTPIFLFSSAPVGYLIVLESFTAVTARITLPYSPVLLAIVICLPLLVVLSPPFVTERKAGQG
jgi:hypothetical protein